jgi:peptide/nickel transport system permease protein
MKKIPFFKNSNGYTNIGSTLILFILVITIFAPFLTNYDPQELNTIDRLQPPSSKHFFGTDELGRDIYARVLYGGRPSVIIATSVVVLVVIIGTTIGIFSGYYKKLDIVIMRFIDGIMAFPSTIIAITMTAIWGAGYMNIILALTFAFFSRMVVIVRSSTLAVRNLEYIDSARVAGASDLYIFRKYVFPNITSPILVNASYVFSTVVLAEAALSFLGIGLEADIPSWGGMISQARNYLSIAPWILAFPCINLAIIVFGLNLLGDGIRDLIDPRLKEKE